MDRIQSVHLQAAHAWHMNFYYGPCQVAVDNFEAKVGQHHVDAVLAHAEELKALIRKREAASPKETVIL